MSVSGALTALYALRCEGVDPDRHYQAAQLGPRFTVKPTLYWGYSRHDRWAFASEVFDAQAGALIVGMTMRLLVRKYEGTPQADQLEQMPLWCDRVLAMLGSDMLLSGTLTEPLLGYMRRVGVLEGIKGRYVGLNMDLRLSVRIEAS